MDRSSVSVFRCLFAFQINKLALKRMFMYKLHMHRRVLKGHIEIKSISHLCFGQWVSCQIRTRMGGRLSKDYILYFKIDSK